ncbi:MAG: 3-octaprenyl-4-hydroxybenzoate carboxy-lyase [Alphaproteobacteria bacterium MarineAlpha2_Bin1]|nr:MAG: 3-octaprenyl-4-hydroxybenzoate carboxy-lyase [Alphaproteobacteria bacterium MarineAlpha2_Bin1]
MYNLRLFLEEEKDNIFRISDPISLNQEITAIQQELDDKGDFPIIYVEKPRNDNGKISKIPVVCNLTASRDITSRALGIKNHEDFARIYSNLTNEPIKPSIISKKFAPVQQTIIKNSDVNLLELPVLTQHKLDPGPYLTSAHATTFDPDTNIDNTSIQRCWVKKKNKMSYYPYPASHNMRNLKKFWNKGEACPVAFWIGHHPKVLMGTQAKLSYPESHWSACGGLLGEPLRLVPSITHGEKIMVPADAEIVIEGYAPVNQLEADGPFGEYTGYMGPQVSSPICEVSCITMRKDPIYHDYGSGHADMLVPDNMVMEGKIYSIVKSVAPSVEKVHVPVSGRRFHAYVQCKNPKIGEVRDALMATLSYRRTKAIIFVDEDINIFSDSDIMFALATRVQWERDSITVNGLQGSLMDPSIVRGAKTVQKIGIDATLAPSEIPNTPAPIPPKNSVAEDALKKAKSLLSNINKDNWPKI